MFGQVEPGGVIDFVAGQRVGRGATNDALVAALAAMGVDPDTRPSSLVVGDGIKGDGNLTYYFNEKSNCGKYTTAQLIKWWEDDEWHEKNPDHPFAYVKCALLNFFAIQARNAQQVPLGKVRKGKKVALIPLNASEREAGKYLKRLDRR